MCNMKITTKDIEGFLTRSFPDHKIKGVCIDPQVEGTYAARVITPKGYTIDLMWCTAQPISRDRTYHNADQLLDDYMEEVEFTAWPPVSGDLKFFV
jgi:hypothetical protein